MTTPEPLSESILPRPHSTHPSLEELRTQHPFFHTEAFRELVADPHSHEARFRVRTDLCSRGLIAWNMIEGQLESLTPDFRCGLLAKTVIQEIIGEISAQRR